MNNAAKKVEDALANILLVGLKFLAALVGINLNQISAKVMKLFNAIRNPVNRAIKWLIDKAVAFAHRTGLVKLVQKGKAKIKQGKEFVKEKGTTLVGKVKAWWNVRKSFKDASGQAHNLFFKGIGKDKVLMGASCIKTYLIFINTITISLLTKQIVSK